MKRYVSITKEGAQEHFFDPIVAGEDPLAVESYFQPFQFEVEEVNVMRTTRIVIDDDNEPAPESIRNMKKKSEGATYEPWCHKGICYRRRVF